MTLIILWCFSPATMSLWARLLKDILLAVVIGMLISSAGAAWVDYDVPGAWPDLIGPSDH